MKLNKVAVFANTTKSNVSNVASKIKKDFEANGVCVDIIKLQSNEEDTKIKNPHCDLAISLGGDGTVLTCAGILEETETPLLAVNMGTFGYIAETSVDEFNEVLRDYLEGKAGIADRMRISASVIRNNKIIFEGSALNDISISSATRSKTAKLNLEINGTFAANLKCDGILVSTATGSTAYNLSAGGPIIEETLNNIIVNPICSFTLNARPLVIDQNSLVEVKIPDQSTDIAVSCDGHKAFFLESGDTVRVKKGQYFTKLVKNTKRNSIEILRDKLGWAGGFNA